MKNLIGGGKPAQIKISDHGTVVSVAARDNLFGIGLAVIKQGAGHLAVPYWDNQLIHQLLRRRQEPRFGPDVLIYQEVESVFAALRQTIHILHANYGVTFNEGMKDRLWQAIETLDQLSLIAAGIKPGNVDQRIGEYRRLIEETFSLVGTQPRDLLKQRVVGYLDQVKAVRDKNGRLNPTATMSRLVAGKTRLQAVLDHVLDIEPKIIARQRALVSIIHYAESLIASLRTFLDLKLTTKFDQVATDHDLQQQTILSLTFFRQQLQRFDMAPYYRPFFCLAEEFDQARQALEEGRNAESYELLQRSRESLKIRQARLNIEQLLINLALEDATPDAAITHPARIQAIINHNIRLLESVDESGFDLPVKDIALPHLTEAAHRLRQLRTGAAVVTDRQFHDAIRLGVEHL